MIKNTMALYTHHNNMEDNKKGFSELGLNPDESLQFHGVVEAETKSGSEKTYPTGSGSIQEPRFRIPHIGEIVVYHPGSGRELPNSMKSAPAIVTQGFGDARINLTVFVADTSGNPVRTAWSVPYVDESTRGEDEGYWDYVD